jgi:hypothetical protein
MTGRHDTLEATQIRVEKQSSGLVLALCLEIQHVLGREWYSTYVRHTESTAQTLTMLNLCIRQAHRVPLLIAQVVNGEESKYLCDPVSCIEDRYTWARLVTTPQHKTFSMHTSIIPNLGVSHLVCSISPKYLHITSIHPLHSYTLSRAGRMVLCVSFLPAGIRHWRELPTYHPSC